jgi:hypothetical protein
MHPPPESPTPRFDPARGPVRETPAWPAPPEAGRETPAPRFDPAMAVVIGHLAVTGPILGLLSISPVVGWYFFGPVGVAVFFPAFVVGWLYWSFTIPRWRRWALRRGADPEQLQRFGELSGLVWPKGFFLEKTEFRLKE